MTIADLFPLANHLWQSTLFAAAVWLLTLALRNNRAAVRHRLWLTASIKFLIPFSLLASIGSSIPWKPASAIEPPRISGVVQRITQPFATSDLFVAPVPDPSDSNSIPKSQTTLIPALLFSVWICGFAASLFWWSTRWRHFHRLVRRATAVDLAVPDIPMRVMNSPERLEPGVFGIFRPVLLLPEGIRERLSTAQLQCVLAHELCHVRRRDNLAAAIHIFVEALFWFHPLVWWIKRRLIDEQERACDEEVLQLGCDPQVYAESILKICEFYLTSPLICVSGITGSNLKKRIEDIMRGRIGVRLGFSRIVLLAVAAMTALAGPIAVGLVHATVLGAHEQTVPALVEPTTMVVINQAQTPRAIERTNSIRRGRPTSFEALVPVEAQVVPGLWMIENPSRGPNGVPFPDRLQLTFYPPGGHIPVDGGGFGNGGDSKSFVFDPVMFRGLTIAQIDSPVRTSARFEIVREAGTFVCEGDFEAGQGRGPFVFHPDPSFRAQLAADFPNIPDKELVGIALTGIPATFLAELHSASLAVPTSSELRRLWTHGVTGDFIRDIQQLGYTPNAEELTMMRMHGVSIDLAREMRQTYPTISISELVDMRIHGRRNR